MTQDYSCPPERVVVVVEGGKVQNVLADTPEAIDVHVVDYDELKENGREAAVHVAMLIGDITHALQMAESRIVPESTKGR